MGEHFREFRGIAFFRESFIREFLCAGGGLGEVVGGVNLTRAWGRSSLATRVRCNPL